MRAAPSRSATPVAVLAFALMFLCSAGCARAEWNIAAEFRIVQLRVAAGVEIVEQFSEERTTPDAVAALNALIRSGDATVVTELFGKGVSGVQQNIESVEETRYTTEYEPPDPQLAPQATSGLAIPAAPTHMEVKNVGATMDYEMEVSADGAILAGLMGCRNVRHLGDLQYEYGVRADGIKYVVHQPKFLAQASTANIVVKNGMPTLMGCYLGRENPERIELHVVTMHSSRIDESGAADGDAEFRRSTRMDVRRYRLAVEDGVRARIAIAGEQRDPSEILRNLMRDGKAALSMCSSLPSVPGQQNFQENILEIRYPTDFEVQGVPDISYLLTAERERRRGVIRARNVERRFLQPPQPYHPPDYLPTVPPSAFEVRNTGSTIMSELGQVGEDDVALMLNLVVQQVDLTGFKRRLKAVEPQGEWVYDYQPHFTTRKTTENRALPVGKWVLQAFHRRPAPYNDIEITIARIKINKVPFIQQKP